MLRWRKMWPTSFFTIIYKSQMVPEDRGNCLVWQSQTPPGLHYYHHEDYQLASSAAVATTVFFIRPPHNKEIAVQFMQSLFDPDPIFFLENGPTAQFALFSIFALIYDSNANEKRFSAKNVCNELFRTFQLHFSSFIHQTESFAPLIKKYRDIASAFH